MGSHTSRHGIARVRSGAGATREVVGSEGGVISILRSKVLPNQNHNYNRGNTCRSSPPHGMRSAVNALNSRYANGRPDERLERSGVILYGLGPHERDRIQQTGKQSWAAVSQHMSVSIINVRLPFAFANHGYVVSPRVAQAGLQCSYPYDSTSQRQSCASRRARANGTCISGCVLGLPGTREWCGAIGSLYFSPGADLYAHGPSASHALTSTEAQKQACRNPFEDEQCILRLSCAWQPRDLALMLMHHEHRIARLQRPLCKCCSWPRCVLYNEVVLSSAEWDWGLPETIEAVYYLAGRPNSTRADAIAEHRRFRQAFGSGCKTVPLVRLDLEAASTSPFELDDACEHQ